MKYIENVDENRWRISMDIKSSLSFSSISMFIYGSFLKIIVGWKYLIIVNRNIRNVIIILVDTS